MLEEQSRRIELAACYRLVEQFGMSDTIYAHISTRLPHDPEVFLINPYGALFEEICASRLVAVGLDGQVRDDSDPKLVNAAGFLIHASIYTARPDVQCIIHTHTVAGTAVSAMARGLLPLSQPAMEFYERIGYHDYEGLATDFNEAAGLVEDLGPHVALILRNHGLLVAGESVPAAFESMHTLEQACRIQLAACATGEALNTPPHEVCEHTASQYETVGTMPKGLRLWRALLRKLDRADASYRE
ncbi:MAG: class II aldolase/adducin family protein [Burkholderiaceae bacterium]